MSSEGRMTGCKRIKAMALVRKAIKWNEPRKFKFVFNVKILKDDVNCGNTNFKWRYWSSQGTFEGQLYHLHYSVSALVFNIPFWRVLSVSKACACFNVADVHWSPQFYLSTTWWFQVYSSLLNLWQLVFAGNGVEVVMVLVDSISNQ